MKNIKKLLILLSVLFVLAVRTNASVLPAECMPINERSTDQWDAGFDVKMDICTYDPYPNGWRLVTSNNTSSGGKSLSGVGYNKGTANGAYELGETDIRKIQYWAQSINGKSETLRSANVAICASKLRMVQARGTCIVRVDPKEPTRSSNAEDPDKNGPYDKKYDPGSTGTCSTATTDVACQNLQANGAACSWESNRCVATDTGYECASNQTESGGKCCPNSKPNNSNGHCCSNNTPKYSGGKCCSNTTPDYKSDNKCCATKSVLAETDHNYCCPSDYPVYNATEKKCCPEGYEYRKTYYVKDRNLGPGCFLRADDVVYVYEYNDSSKNPNNGHGDDFDHVKDDYDSGMCSASHGSTSSPDSNNHACESLLIEACMKNKDRIPDTFSDVKYDIGRAPINDYNIIDNESSKFWAYNIHFDLMCPFYKCQDKENPRQLDACVTTYESPMSSSDAYCINPTMTYNPDVKFQPYNVGFDMTNCERSNQTEDCGYSNILVMAECKEIDNKAVYLALRLWARYYNGEGFGNDGLLMRRTGIANVASKIHKYNEKEGVCDKQVYYIRPGNGQNFKSVYEETFQANMDVINAAIRGDFDVFESTNGINVATCSAQGIACDDHGKQTVINAYKLLANTISGNRLIDFLKNCGANGSAGDLAFPTRAELVDKPTQIDDDGKVWVRISYTEKYSEKFVNENMVIDCKELGKYSPEQQALIKPYCTTEITLEKDGQVVEPTACIKNRGCYYKTSITAICDESQGETSISEVWVNYTNYSSRKEMVRYISCGGNINASGQTDDMIQQMVVYYKDGQDWTETNEKSNYKNIPIENFECRKPGCTDHNLKFDGMTSTGSGQCVNNNSFTASVKDPSLACIVNMSNTSEQTKYDYSDEFGVNDVASQFCRIYCSDTITYYLDGKKSIYSGRTFTYDLLSKESNKFFASSNSDSNNDKHKLTAVVKEKRTCVSDIRYDKVIPGSKTDAFARKYDVPPTGNGYTWQELYAATASGGGYDGNSKTNVNTNKDRLAELLYELYVCNLKTQGQIPSVLREHSRSNTKIMESIINAFDASNNYNLEKSDSNYSNYTDEVYYPFGSYLSHYSTTGDHSSESVTTSRVGDFSNKVGMTKATSNGNPFTVTKNFDIRYCQGDCLNNFDSYDYPSTGYSEGGGSLELDGASVGIPNNSYAFFDVTAEFDFYNDNAYQVINNTGHIAIESDNSLITLPKYSYPTDITAFNTDENTLTAYSQAKCKKEVKIVNGQEKTVNVCPVTQRFSLGTFNRIASYNADKLKQFLNKKQNLSCTINIVANDISCPESKNCPANFQYRNVDLSNLFPQSGNNGYVYPKNWRTQRGEIARNTIQNNASKVYGGTELLQYSISLNPKQINNIKNDFKDNSYLNEVTYSCDEPKDGFYFNCESEFLDTLRKGTPAHEPTKYGSLLIDGGQKTNISPD